MYINRKEILNSLLQTVEGISNKEYQKRVWIRGEGPECDDFDETVCHFSQLGNGVLEDCEEFQLTENQYAKLEKFRDEFEKFYRKNDWPEFFIDTQEWDEITKLAKGVLAAFNYQAKS